MITLLPQSPPPVRHLGVREASCRPLPSPLDMPLEKVPECLQRRLLAYIQCGKTEEKKGDEERTLKKKGAVGARLAGGASAPAAAASAAAVSWGDGN